MKVCKFPDFLPDNMPGTRKRVPALLLALALTTCAWSINLDDVRPVTLQQSQVSVRTALDEIAGSASAQVNLVVSSSALPLAKLFQKKYGAVRRYSYRRRKGYCREKRCFERRAVSAAKLQRGSLSPLL